MSEASYNTYAIGQTAVIEAFNRDPETGELLAAPNPRIFLKPPSGTETELAVTEDPDGHIYHDYRILPGASAGPGTYYYRIVTDEDSIERAFVVPASEFAAPLGP